MTSPLPDPRDAERPRSPPAAGWKMVPVEPTDEMILARNDGFGDGTTVAQFRNEWRRVLAAAPSPPATAGVRGWRPIESAPKDGTAVLLFFPKRYQGKGGVSWGCFVNGDWLDSRAIRDNDATHWMPLPAPPESNGERK